MVVNKLRRKTGTMAGVMDCYKSTIHGRHDVAITVMSIKPTQFENYNITLVLERNISTY